MRLGAPHSKYNMKALKAHPFFSGIDWNNLDSLSVLDLLKDEEEKIHKQKVEENSPNNLTMSELSISDSDILF